MPGREEVLHSLYGAYLLARMNTAGMAHFNLSVDGFWRSFFAAVLVAPGYALLVAQRMIARAEPLDFGWVLVVQGSAYIISWAAFPLVAIILTYALNLTRNYVPLIVAANWAAVLQVGLFLLVLLLTLVLPGELAGLLLTFATISILFYQWFVTCTALQTTGGIALLVVMVDLLLNTAINVSAERLL